MSKHVPAWSDNTHTKYPSWDALVLAESNGWLATLILSNGKQTWTWSEGPFPGPDGKKEAKNAVVRMRKRVRKEIAMRAPHTVLVSTSTRPAWKPKAQLEAEGLL